MGDLNEAEQRFAAYLNEHGYTWKHEPDYHVELAVPAPLATTPDFLIERNGSRAVAEVRQFETTHIRDRLAKSGGYAALSPQEVYGSLRSGMFVASADRAKSTGQRATNESQVSSRCPGRRWSRAWSAARSIALPCRSFAGGSKPSSRISRCVSVCFLRVIGS
jgi:hypothetical protein